MDAGGDLAEIVESLIGFKSDDRVGGVSRFEADSFLVAAVSLHGKIAIDAGDYDIAACGPEGAVDNKKVAVMNPSFDHGVALNADKVGCSRSLDEKFVQVKGRLEVLFGRRREPRNYRSGDFCFGTHLLAVIMGLYDIAELQRKVTPECKEVVLYVASRVVERIKNALPFR